MIPRQSNRLAATLFLTQSLFSAGFIGIITLLSVIAKDLSGTDSAAGLPGTLLTVGQALFAFPLGLMMDRYGRRLTHSSSYALGMIGALVGIVAITQGSFIILLLAALLLGGGRSGGEQVRYTVAELYPEVRRATVIGIIIFAGTAGSVFGPLLVPPAGRFATSIGLEERAGAWLMTALFLGLATLLIQSLLRPDPRDIGRRIRDAESAERRKTDIHYVEPAARSTREIFQKPLVQLALLSMVIGQTVMVALMTITPVHMLAHGYQDYDVPIVIAAHTLGMFGIAPITGILADRFGRVNMILAGAVILILAAVTAPLSTAMWVLIVSLFLLGLGWNFCFIGGSSLLSDALSSNERGKIQGTADALVAISAGTGSLSSGILFDVGGYVLVAVIGLVLTIVLTGMIGNLAPRQLSEA